MTDVIDIPHTLIGFSHFGSAVESPHHRNSAAIPDEQVIHITQGYSRNHRPDLNQVMLELIVEHQAGIPLLMQPLSGNTNDSVEFGRVIPEHVTQLQTAHHVTYLIADGALSSADTLSQLAQSGLQ